MIKKTINEKPFEPGDIFSLKLNDGRYAFGRCISKVSIGHVVEIFDYISEKPDFNIGITEKRMFDPIPIDSYSTIRTGSKGEWQVIGKTENYVPTNVDHIRYTYGAGPTRKVVDFRGTLIAEISEEDSKKYPDYSPTANFWVIKKIDLAVGN